MSAWDQDPGEIKSTGGHRKKASVEWFTNFCSQPYSALHPRLLEACRAGKNVNLSNCEIGDIIIANFPACHRRIEPSELARILGDYNSALAKSGPAIEMTEINWDKVNDLIQEGKKIGLATPLTYAIDQAKAYLHSLFEPGESICVGGFKATEVFKVEKVNRWLAKKIPEFCSVNPLDIYRRDEQCTRYTNAVIEHDIVSPEDSLSMIKALIKRKTIREPLAITHSGSKSVHLVFRVKCSNYEEWCDKIKPHYKQTFAELGFDPTTSNPSRLTRFAGHIREGKGMQQLLWSRYR